MRLATRWQQNKNLGYATGNSEPTIKEEFATSNAIKLANTRPAERYFETYPELSRALDAFSAYDRFPSLAVVYAIDSFIIVLVRSSSLLMLSKHSNRPLVHRPSHVQS